MQAQERRTKRALYALGRDIAPHVRVFASLGPGITTHTDAPDVASTDTCHVQGSLWRVATVKLALQNSAHLRMRVSVSNGIPGRTPQHHLHEIADGPSFPIWES